VGLERGPLSLVSTVDELLERKGSGSGLETRDYGRRGFAAVTTRQPSIRKRWHYLGRQAALARGLNPRSLVLPLYVRGRQPKQGWPTFGLPSDVRD
jgi:hypothetical protein